MTTTYKFIRDGIEETVNLEPYRWHAIYNDNTELFQFDQDGVFHQLAEIDQSKLHVFQILNEDNKSHCAFIFKPNDMKLIYFYKRYHLDVGGPNDRHVTLYVSGYEQSNGKVMNVITPSGEVITVSDLNDLQVV